MPSSLTKQKEKEMKKKANKHSEVQSMALRGNLEALYDLRDNYDYNSLNRSQRRAIKRRIK